MSDVNERLRKAAEKGSEIKLKDLLRDPDCDALSKSESGMTALMCAAHRGKEACVRLLLPASDALARSVNGMTVLMWAARYGHEGCVRILLPASDALAESNNGLTASAWAREKGHESVAQFIDAYALAQSERDAIGGAVSSRAPRVQPVRRV